MTSRYLEPFYRHLRSIFDTESTGRMLLYSPLVGVVAGLGAAGFYWALSWLWKLAVEQGMGYFAPQAGSEPSLHTFRLPTPDYFWAVLLIPAVGGLVCGWLVYRFAPEAEGHGTDAMVRAFHRQRGEIRPRVPVIKSIASVLTIGTGGSAGREGPIAQIGAGFGSLLATRLQLGEQDRRQLMLAGAAGGIGAIFHAPLGGALFITEVLYGSTALEFTVVIPCVISSIMAFTVFSMIFGPMQAVTAPANLEFTHLSELPVFVVFALLCSLVGYLYVLTFYGLRNRLFQRLPIPNTFKPALGGLMLGALAINLPQIMGGGYGWIQRAIDNELTMGLMLTLGIAKMLATSLTISSGGSGGVFAPSLFIGAMLGGAFSQACEYFFPGVIQDPAAYVLVGMGGFFAGVAKVPLTAVIMVSEMSGSYGLLVPLMLVSIINVAVLSSRWSLYEEQVPTILDSPAHQGDFIVDVLEQIQVKEIFRPDRRLDLIPQNTPLPEILRLAALSENNYFPVVDDHQALVGIFSLRDLRSVLTGDGAGRLVVAIDIATQPVLTVAPEDDLHTALRRFTQKNIDDIPVVAKDRPTEILGLLSRKDLIAAYHNRVTDLQHHEQTTG